MKYTTTKQAQEFEILAAAASHITIPMHYMDTTVWLFEMLDRESIAFLKQLILSCPSKLMKFFEGKMVLGQTCACSSNGDVVLKQDPLYVPSIKLCN